MISQIQVSVSVCVSLSFHHCLTSIHAASVWSQIVCLHAELDIKPHKPLLYSAPYLVAFDFNAMRSKLCTQCKSKS